MAFSYHPLSRLICGNIRDAHSESSLVFNRLNYVISKFSNKLLDLDLAIEDERELAPFYARNILEGACSVLLGRYDFFRLFSVYKVQSSSSYDITKKSSIALQWTGDIIANTTRTRGQNLWHPEYKLTDYDRALLGNEVGELLWKPGYLNLIDSLSESSITKTSWIERIETRDENQFFQTSKTEAMNLFSAFSKGVHHEFLINADNIYDATTVQDYVLRMIQLIAELGLVSHHCGILINDLSVEEGMLLFQEIEELIKTWQTRMA